MNLKPLFISALPIILTGCTLIGEVETQILMEAAIADARQASKEVHLAYLQCYALPKPKKSNCQRKISGRSQARGNASNWEYILPYNYQAERLGFVAFLRDRGKPCSGVIEGVRYHRKQKAYVVNCTDGNRYHMRFIRKVRQWDLVEATSARQPVSGPQLPGKTTE